MGDTKKLQSKPIHRTASPFTVHKLSKIPQPQHDIVANLLINALSPIGSHQANLSKPAKKRCRKCKRKGACQQAPQQTAADAKRPVTVTVKTTPPEVKQHILLGFNSVTRELEDLSAHSRQARSSAMTEHKDIGPHLAAVFLFRPMDDLIYSHLPSLCYTASLARPQSPPTRLVLLDPSIETKVASAMAQTRSVSLLAVKDSSYGVAELKALVDYVRENVEAVEMPWIKQAAEAQWLGTKVDVQ